MKKSDIKDDKTLNEYYLKSRKIKFDDSIEIKTVDDIIQNLWYLNNSTYYIKNSEHCIRNKYRSINDFLKICKTYFPKMLVRTAMDLLVLHEIHKPIEKGQIKPRLIVFRYCPDIKMTNSGGVSGFSWNPNIHTISTSIKLGVTLEMNPQTWDFKCN